MMATRMKRVTQSATKRRIATQSKKTKRQLVNLREQIDRWKDFSLENNCKHDGEVARMLLDRFYRQDEPEVKRRKTSTPAAKTQKNFLEMSTSSISPNQSDREFLSSGLETIHPSSQSESDTRRKGVASQRTPKRSKRLPIVVQDKTAPSAQVAQISIDEISDPDACEYYDEEDESYVPSLWEMSMSINDPVSGEIVEKEDISCIVHDIELPAEDV